jgi:hypothetical protein
MHDKSQRKKLKKKKQNSADFNNILVGWIKTLANSVGKENIKYNLAWQSN